MRTGEAAVTAEKECQEKGSAGSPPEGARLKAAFYKDTHKQQAHELTCDHSMQTQRPPQDTIVASTTLTICAWFASRQARGEPGLPRPLSGGGGGGPEKLEISPAPAPTFPEAMSVPAELAKGAVAKKSEEAAATNSMGSPAAT